MQDSVFTKIIKGKLPCHKIYEDERSIAFLTIEPLATGHTLVVPKIQIDDFEKLPDEDYEAVFNAVKEISTRIKEVLGVRKVIVNILGFEVPHAHIHLIPANSEGEFFQAIENRANIPKEPDHNKLAAIAERLKF